MIWIGLQNNENDKACCDKQQDDLQSNFDKIKYLMSFQVFSDEDFLDHMDTVDKERKDALQKLNAVDLQLSTVKFN
ncbi:hypothetical protein [Metabacillus sp. RGM 3146]|uniref:hypothetical protein n=1 Tax=Metabacillus sp. RGM 3146 TaxID=3401092 RepID=UPI003B9DC093